MENKELEALERLKSHILILEELAKVDKTSVNPYAIDYQVVKFALNRLEKLEKAIEIVKRKGVNIDF